MLNELSFIYHKFKFFVNSYKAQSIFELLLSLFVGILVGALMIFSQRLPNMWQGFIILIPIVFVSVMLVNDLQKIISAAIAISVPLNLDVSLIISSYSKNPENLARGNRTLIALTELRLSLCLVVVIVGYALWVLEVGGPKYKSPRFFIGTTVPILLLIFFSLLSVFQATDRQLSLFRLVQLLELFLVYFYLANRIRTIEDMQFFIVVSTIGMLAESILMVVQWITNLEFIIAGIEASTYGPGRVGGTLGNPGPAGGYLAAHLLITAVMIWAFPKNFSKGWIFVSLGIGLIALIGTGSRISWGAFAMTSLLFFGVGLDKGWIKLGVLFALFMIFLIVTIPFFDQIYGRYTGDDNDSTDSRKRMYKLAWNMIQKHPWFGVGVGNQALKTRDYYTSDVGKPEGVLDKQVHNRYLLIWAESGTFAFLAFISIFISTLIRAWQCVKSEHTWVSVIGAGFGAATLSICIQMLTSTLLGRAHTLFAWLLPALVASLYNISDTYPNTHRAL